jgi:hypothetical protein
MELAHTRIGAEALKPATPLVFSGQLGRLLPLLHFFCSLEILLFLDLASDTLSFVLC